MKKKPTTITKVRFPFIVLSLFSPVSSYEFYSPKKEGKKGVYLRFSIQYAATPITAAIATAAMITTSVLMKEVDAPPSTGDSPSTGSSVSIGVEAVGASSTVRYVVAVEPKYESDPPKVAIIM